MSLMSHLHAVTIRHHHNLHLHLRHHRSLLPSAARRAPIRITRTWQTYSQRAMVMVSIRLGMSVPSGM
jgi:hypothetical protein